MRDWASVAGRGRLLLSGSVDHASLKPLYYTRTLDFKGSIINETTNNELMDKSFPNVTAVMEKLEEREEFQGN